MNNESILTVFRSGAFRMMCTKLTQQGKPPSLGNYPPDFVLCWIDLLRGELRSDMPKHYRR